MNNKEKNARIVTFKEDYASKVSGQPIYRKGQVVAMHHTIAKQLQEKGAKIDVKSVDVEAGVKRLKQKRAENLKKVAALV